MSPPPQVTDEQIAAAQLRVILDSKLGRETPDRVRRIAAATGTDETEPVSPPPEPPPSPALPADPTTLLTALGVELDTELLTLALTHRSYAYEHGGLPPNERLEFLGDAVLGWVITDHLYRQHPDLPEGQLARLRAGVVNMQALAGVARGLGPGGLGAHLLLGKGEELTGGRDKSSILADGMEAVIGAVYLEHGTETARQLVHRLFGPLLNQVRRRGAGLDWKTSLQDLTSGAGLGVPEYLLQEAGPDHLREYTATVVVGGEERGSGAGRTKKEAEQRAAEIAWRTIAEMIDSDINPGF